MEIKLQKPRNAGDWLRLYLLYLEAFPPSERKPFAVIRNMYRQGKADVWCILGAGKFVGMATTVNGNDLILIDYFAVTVKYRRQGIGSGAIACLLSLYGHKGVFLEIESTQTPGPEAELRQKRKEFYISCGLKPLDVKAKVFGVPMELLGIRCKMNYADYYTFYRENMGPWTADHLEEI